MNCELRPRKADCQNGCKQHAKTTFHNKQVALVCCVKLCEHNFIICCFSTACCVNCMSVTSCCVSPTACCVKLCERYIMLLDVALARRRVRVEWQRENVLVVFFFPMCCWSFILSGRNTFWKVLYFVTWLSFFRRNYFIYQGK